MAARKKKTSKAKGLTLLCGTCVGRGWLEKERVNRCASCRGTGLQKPPASAGTTPPGVPRGNPPARPRRQTKQQIRDSQYRAALGLPDDSPIPSSIGNTEGHGGPQNVRRIRKIGGPAPRRKAR
ncbi:hypothetical protein CCE02nite_32830 [Cellulosimicrobium cellulans]|uniref:Uncharacterized protein n=1 Tax=Cellulosimicrobium cellulans TaxID=1710 RepID=A0A4Y4E5H3_CELCE|nr:hypothetical protein CCE02nite_32830 [Cellulosimicrobium cellulans]